MSTCNRLELHRYSIHCLIIINELKLVYWYLINVYEISSLIITCAY